MLIDACRSCPINSVVCMLKHRSNGFASDYYQSVTSFHFLRIGLYAARSSPSPLHHFGSRRGLQIGSHFLLKTGITCNKIATHRLWPNARRFTHCVYIRVNFQQFRLSEMCAAVVICLTMYTPNVLSVFEVAFEPRYLLPCSFDIRVSNFSV